MNFLNYFSHRSLAVEINTEKSKQIFIVWCNDHLGFKRQHVKWISIWIFSTWRQTITHKTRRRRAKTKKKFQQKHNFSRNIIELRTMRSSACPLRALHSRHFTLKQQESVWKNGSLFQPELNTSLIESLNNTISERWCYPSLSLPVDILSIEGTAVAYGNKQIHNMCNAVWNFSFADRWFRWWAAAHHMQSREPEGKTAQR